MWLWFFLWYPHRDFVLFYICEFVVTYSIVLLGRMECGICSEEYDQMRLTPRNLQCGHTFCSRCCMNLVDSHAIICPKCRMKTRYIKDIKDLSVNYPLLEILNNDGRDAASTTSMKKEQGLFTDYKKKEQTSPHAGRCLEAQAEVAMHCAHCDLWLCKDCSRIDHKHPECVLVPYQDTIKEMSQAGEVKIRTSQHSVENVYRKANAYGNKLSSCAAIMEITLDCIKKERSNLPGVLINCRKLEEEMNDITVKHVPTNVEDALSYLKKMEMVTEDTQLWAVRASDMLKIEEVLKLSKVSVIEIFLFNKFKQQHFSSAETLQMGYSLHFSGFQS